MNKTAAYREVVRSGPSAFGQLTEKQKADNRRIHAKARESSKPPKFRKTT